MKRFWLVAVLLALGVVLAGAPPALLSKNTRGAVYNLWVVAEKAMAIICTGAVVATSDGPRFLTAGHCVEDMPRSARYYISNDVDPDYLVRVRLKWWKFNGTEQWKDGDFAVFEIPQSFKSPALPLCSNNPAPGESIWAWTAPLGMLPILYRSGAGAASWNGPHED